MVAVVHTHGLPSMWRVSKVVTKGAPMNLQTAKPSFTPVQANDVDAQLEYSLTHEWDAQIMTYPNEKYPFNEWILNRIRKMGYPVEDLNYLHKVVPQPE